MNYLSHVNGSRVTVVQSNAVEDACRLFNVLSHEVPQVGRIFGPLSVSQFHAVAPGDQLSAQVNVGSSFGKVLEGIVVHDPAIVRHDVGGVAGEHGGFIVGQSVIARTVEIAEK